MREYLQAILSKIKTLSQEYKIVLQNFSIKVKNRLPLYRAFLIQTFFKAKNKFQFYSALKKRMLIMLTILFLLFGIIFIFHLLKAYQMQKYFKMGQPPIVVSAQSITYENWQPKIQAFGSVRAIQGVDVTSEVPGLVRQIQFKSGTTVKAGERLAELNADADIARLNSLKAIADLAEITYQRDKEQYTLKAVSKATVDASFADFRSKEAAVTEQSNMVAKKTICAPFNGLLGISAIDEGQYINPGDKIVTLQYLHPIYVDFHVPQQELKK